ncbi:uncharacterized protein TNCV_1557831 [Trichonephila clavipes]|uniref:Uncharacterized protein n=1 Tax=Trichonephila clavipes TaxID=2585209 RepID=A0A8X6UUZ1_TRICX|nr:uncharacterized protein TNCV_1557831 [Trichonephila clavipes]
MQAGEKRYPRNLQNTAQIIENRRIDDTEPLLYPALSFGAQNQKWEDFSRVRATSNFFKVMCSFQWRRYGEAALIVLYGGVGTKLRIYAKTRLRTPSTDQYSRRPPYRQKCTRTANCFIGRHPGTIRTYSRAPVSSRTKRRRLAEGHLRSRCPLCVLPLTLPFAFEPRSRKLDCSEMEPGRL